MRITITKADAVARIDAYIARRKAELAELEGARNESAEFEKQLFAAARAKLPKLIESMAMRVGTGDHYNSQLQEEGTLYVTFDGRGIDFTKLTAKSLGVKLPKTYTTSEKAEFGGRSIRADIVKAEHDIKLVKLHAKATVSGVVIKDLERYL